MPSKSPNRQRSRHETNTSPCVFQRLMIVHYQLPEMCIDGGLDEGASLEELSEHILYYHHDTSTNSGSVNTSTEEQQYNESHATSDAVQFAGLCSALLSLPNAVTGNNESSSTDETREVHLAGSTLVFVPLEQIGIMAIAQIERRSSPGEQHQNANPLAVRKSLEKCHDLFCLLRGGIHQHLSTEETSGDSGVQRSIMNILQSKEEACDQTIYPGMTELYSLRKRVRQLKRDISRSNDAAQQNELALSTTELDKRIQSLMDTLPITALKEQLRTHYDEYIADAGLVAAATGVLHNCFVDNVPAPLVKPTETLMREYPPILPSLAAVNCLKEVVQSLFDNTAGNCDSDEPLLVGISSFFNGNLLFASCNSCSDDASLVCPRTACLLMEFMTSYRHKIFVHAKQHSGQQSLKARSPPRRIGSGLRRFLSSSLIDEDTITAIDPADTSINTTTLESIHFLEPPPLSMLNVSDQVLQVDLPSHGSVWTPQVYLPLEQTRADGDSSTCTETLEANLVLLDIGDYSFLLYLRPVDERDDVDETGPQSTSLDDKSITSNEQDVGMASSAVITIPAYSRLLEMIAMDLSNAVTAARDLEEEQSVEEETRDNPFAESGQHVVFIDRASQRVVLYSDGDERNNKKSTRNEQTSVDISSGIDCRHVLASNLPPNVVAAFDDLMNQVRERMMGSKEEVLQLCTYLPQGWVYAHTQDAKELYMFFNANKFVTVSDVQHAADRVRLELFKDSYR